MVDHPTFISNDYFKILTPDLFEAWNMLFKIDQWYTVDVDFVFERLQDNKINVHGMFAGFNKDHQCVAVANDSGFTFYINTLEKYMDFRKRVLKEPMYKIKVVCYSPSYSAKCKGYGNTKELDEKLGSSPVDNTRKWFSEHMKKHDILEDPSHNSNYHESDWYTFSTILKTLDKSIVEKFSVDMLPSIEEYDSEITKEFGARKAYMFDEVDNDKLGTYARCEIVTELKV